MFLERETPKNLLLSHPCTQKEEVMGAHLQVRRELSPETTLASTLILTFPAPQTMRKKFLLYKPPDAWYFVMAAHAH